MTAENQISDPNDGVEFEKLSDAEQMFRLLQEVEQISHVGGWDLDFRNGKLTWSDEVYRIHEVSPGTTITPENATAFYPEDVLPEIREVVDKAIESGEPWDVELPMITAKGRNIWVRGIGRPLKKDGETYRIIGTFQEITKQKQGAEEREHLIDDLRRKNEEMERFLYTVSHDLKVPLATLKGYMGQLEKSALSGNAKLLKADCASIRRQVENMSDLLDKLLELSRAGRVVETRETITLKRLIDDALELCGVRLTDPPIEVILPRSFPAIRGDRSRLLQVLQNLIGNAMKFSGEQVQQRIEIRIEKRADEILCSIADNGIGLKTSDCERIFDLFVTVPKRSSGSGVGLAVAKRIIEAHGGHIWAESAGPGKGCTVLFTLPR